MKTRAAQLEANLELMGSSILIEPDIPRDNFKEFNRVVGNPILPATGESSDIFDYQEEYERAWNRRAEY